MEGDWKLLIQNLISKNKEATIQLFNIKDDIAEKKDLSKENPETVIKLLQKMKQSHIHSGLFPFPELEEFFGQSAEDL